ncbi:hypothetical protein SAMN05421819_2117 [Bryocella elongata]|uniref:Glycosyltransferase RgtA/B/C/D-like domain-containing protein n=1 Tax=Bryocella elongata TaxID=863522 RepID=A0A1H5Y573_9BACT|nr:hypothetical protein [Bryocella elongata]SEG18847.1 hypothetical protein SAMN05421819_2117 [Bryocella elongata]
MPDAGKQRRLTFVALIFGFVSIGAYCVLISRGRTLWSDELFSWVLVTDPSFAHMMRAWKGGADGGGIAFYLLCRGWLSLFGQSHLAYRAFSASCCFAAWALMLAALRRYYRAGIAFLALVVVWFGSSIILWQMVQTRFYGLLFAATAAALYVTLLGRKDRPFQSWAHWGLIVGTFLLHLLLVNTHPLGLLDSACLLAGAAVADWMAGRRRFSLHLAALMAWPSLWLSREALRNSAAVGRPWFWTTRPHIREWLDLWDPITFQSQGVLRLTHVMVALGGVLVIALVARPSVRSAARPRLDLLLPATALGLTPLPVFLLSQHGTSIFVDRYLIASLLGVTVWFAEAFTQTLSVATPSRHQRLVLGIGTSALLAFCLVKLGFYPRYLRQPSHDFTILLSQRVGDTALPLAIPRVDLCDVMVAEAQQPHPRVLCPLDWPFALSPLAARGEVSGYHEMENWRTFGYYSGSLIEADEFLRNTPHFLVLDSPTTPWLKFRIFPSTQWTAIHLRDLRVGSDDEQLWEVARKDGR